jgi:hypothetical protein
MAREKLNSCREHPQIANLSVIRRFDYESNDHVACLFVHHVGSAPSTTTISLNNYPARYILGPRIPSASSTVHNQHEVILTHDRKTIHHHVCPCVRHSTIQSQHFDRGVRTGSRLIFGDIGRARIRRRLSTMAMELFMYLIYFAYMKKLDCPQLIFLFRACNVNVAFGFFSPENARFCFLETQATVTSRSMDVASFLSIVLSFHLLIDGSGTPQSAICRLFVGVLQPAPPLKP